MAIHKIIDQAVNEELDRAIEINGHFHNAHEAWALLKEEVEELGDGFREIRMSDGRLATEGTMDEIWEAVKADEFEGIPEMLLDIRNTVEPLAHEAIQVLAMCKKFRMLVEEKGENHEKSN